MTDSSYIGYMDLKFKPNADGSTGDYIDSRYVGKREELVHELIDKVLLQRPNADGNRPRLVDLLRNRHNIICISNKDFEECGVEPKNCPMRSDASLCLTFQHSILISKDDIGVRYDLGYSLEDPFSD